MVMVTIRSLQYAVCSLQFAAGTLESLPTANCQLPTGFRLPTAYWVWTADYQAVGTPARRAAASNTLSLAAKGSPSRCASSINDAS